MPRRVPHALLPDVVRVERPNLFSPVSAMELIEKEARDRVAPRPATSPGISDARNPRQVEQPREGLLTGVGDLVPAALRSLDESANVLDAIDSLDRAEAAAAEEAEVAAEDARVEADAVVDEARQLLDMPPRGPTACTKGGDDARSEDGGRLRLTTPRMVALVLGITVSILIIVMAATSLARAARLRKCAEKGGAACDRLDELDLLEGGRRLAGGTRRKRPSPPKGQWASLE